MPFLKTMINIGKYKSENNVLNYKSENNVLKYNKNLLYYNKYTKQYIDSIKEYEKYKNIDENIDEKKLKDLEYYELSKTIENNIGKQQIKMIEIMMTMIILQNKRIEQMENNIVSNYTYILNIRYAIIIMVVVILINL